MSIATQISEQAVLAALKVVQDPDLRKDIVSLGFVKNIKIGGGHVAFDIELTTPACPVKDLLKEQARKAVSEIEGVTNVAVTMTSNVRRAITGLQLPVNLIPKVKNSIAIASGKGGVGKSTVAVNLAIALAQTGATVGLLDADIYGPSVSSMIKNPAEPRADTERKIVPLERYGVKYMTMGVLAPQDTATIVRGPIAHKLIQQLLGGVAWDDLDYLLIDLPPGTGDIHLTLTQSVALTGAVVVTTPQDVAASIAGKGLKMFQKMQVPILGVIENMSYYACGHCGEKTHIFRAGGGRAMAGSLGVPFLGEIPVDPAISETGDLGDPVVHKAPDSAAAQAFRQVASETARWVSIVNSQIASAVTPKEYVYPKNGPLTISWSDNRKTSYPYRSLRALCPCATCVDENSGRRVISEQEIPDDIQLEYVSPIGRYALTFVWSDGHQTGIYPFEYLLEIGKAA